MIEAKAKRTVRRAPVKKAANSPAPVEMGSAMNPTCGHDGCGRACNVRYVGATSSIRDHHVMHIARGMQHVWTAAIVSGLAVVLTGAFAFTAVQAASPASTSNSLANQLSQINQRLNSIDTKLNQLLKSGPGMMGAAQTDGDATATRVLPPVKGDAKKGPPPTAAPSEAQHTCMESCTKTTLGCLKTAGSDATSRQTCMKTDTSCRQTCGQATPAASSATDAATPSAATTAPTQQ